MAVEVAIIQGTAKTGATGTKDYTSSGFGTPQAAILLYSRCASGSNPNVQAIYSVGFVDGTRESVVANRDIDDRTATENTRYGNTDGCIIDYTYAGAKQDHAEFNQWITDGIRLNWLVTASSEWYITIILLKGLTNAYAGVKQLTSSGANDITDPGFKPDLVLITTCGGNRLEGFEHAILGVGAAHNNSSNLVSQAFLGYNSVDALAFNSNIESILRDDSCTGQLFNGANQWYGVASDFDVNGFTITPNASPGDDYIFYLALKLDNPNDADVSVIDTPITTGIQSYSDPGFLPSFLMLLQGMASQTNTITRADQGVGLGVSDGTNERCNAFSADDAASKTNTQTNYATTAISEVYGGPATKRFDATVSSFDANGFSLNFTTTDGTARKWIAITLKNTGAGPAVTGNAIMFGTNF